MLSYIRGILVAYRDVLNMIECLDLDQSDAKIDALQSHIARRIDMYIARQISNTEID